MLLAVGVAIAGCSDSDRSALAYRDLIAEDRFVTPEGPAVAGIVGCNEASYHGFTLFAGASLETTIALGHAPSLVLGGCRTEGAPDTLVFQIEPRPGLTRRVRVPIGNEPGRFTARLSLEELGGRRIDLRLEPHFAPGMVALEDAFVEQRAPRPPLPAQPAFQALLISVDTLRADTIGSLGGRWPTPHLDRLVAESEVFTNSWATASWTKPSHGSLLTGEMPAVHAAERYTDALHPAVPTIAERLASKGIVSAAIVQDIVHLDPRFGFDRGFDTYRVADWSFEQMARRSIDWLGAHRDRPFFFFLHTFETHSDFRRLPYESPGARDDTLAARFDLGAGYGCTVDGALCASERLDAIRQGTVDALTGEAGGLAYLYGESVRHTDRVLGRLFDDLRALGLWDRMLIVLTSDHGEMLLEAPGETLHGVHRPAVLRVPLVLKWPAATAGARRAGLIRPEPVSAIDVMPTLLRAAGIATEDLPGVDLSGRLDPDRHVLIGTETISLVAGDAMLVQVPDNEPRLLALSDDSALHTERAAVGTTLDDIDRLATHMARLETALARLAQRRARFDQSGKPTAPPLTEEERAKLRAFGYTDS